MDNLITYSDVEEQSGFLAECVARSLNKAILERGTASLAVPGGRTPLRFLTELGGADLNWHAVRVLLTDERYVPETSERSNTRLLKETLFQGNASMAFFCSVYEKGAKSENVLPRITHNVKSSLPLDVCVVGMGTDGHIASLFPGGHQLAEAISDDCQTPVLTMRVPGSSETRITLTAPVLGSSKELHLLIQGKQKLKALITALTPGPVAEAPVRTILKHKNLKIHYAENTLK